MAGQPARSLGAQSAAELRQNMQDAFRASVLDLSRPKRDELRQIALARAAPFSSTRARVRLAG